MAPQAAAVHVAAQPDESLRRFLESDGGWPGLRNQQLEPHAGPIQAKAVDGGLPLAQDLSRRAAWAKGALHRWIQVGNPLKWRPPDAPGSDEERGSRSIPPARHQHRRDQDLQTEPACVPARG